MRLTYHLTTVNNDKKGCRKAQQAGKLSVYLHACYRTSNGLKASVCSTTN